MERYELEVNTESGNMDTVMNFIEEYTKSLDNPKVSQQLAIVVEELAFNVFSYAYSGYVGMFTLTIELYAEERKILLEFRDSGIPYNPLENKDPDTTMDISERKIGGMGVMMSKHMTDEQTYKRENGENILTVTKKY